jgi:hypothetical protein
LNTKALGYLQLEIIGEKFGFKLTMLTPLEEAMEMILNGKENSPLILRFRSC